MKKWMTTLAILFAIAGAYATDTDGYYIYKSDADGGTGGWADSTRWRDGVAPSSGDKVKINGATAATATDADMALISTLSEILVNYAKATLTFTLESEGHVTGILKGSGTVIKEGAGALYLDKTSSTTVYNMEGGFVINNGELHFPTLSKATTSTMSFGPVTVNKPGVLYTVDGCLTSIAGLSGDGTVTRNKTAEGSEESTGQLKCTGGTASSPFVFSGVLSNNVSLTMSGGNQRFTRTDETVGRTVRFYSGLIELAAMNGANGDSVTKAETYYMRGTSGKTMTLRYVGDGPGICSHTFLGSTDTYNPIIDGGPHGELTVSGEIQATSKSSGMCRYTFAGDHETPCAFTGKFTEKSDLSLATYITKTGTGTWRFSGSTGRQCNGVFEVRNGALEFDSIAERGKICSLGYQNVLHSNYFGTRDESRAVPYAFRLGDGTDAVRTATGTLSYVGTADASCSTRPIALSGAGRLRNASACRLDWAGVTSLDANGGTLVLDGTGTTDVVRDVTNGVGAVSIVKEGTGTWTLDGDLDISGAVAANGGALNVRNGKTYRWFRFNVRSTWYQVYQEQGKGGDMHVMLTGLTLLSEDRVNWASALNYQSSKNNAHLKLLPGEVCYGNSGSYDSYSKGGRELGKLFAGATWQGGSKNSKGDSVAIDPNDSNTWVRVVMRLPDEALPIVRYDIKTGNKSNVDGLPYYRELRSWSLEASLDGRVWTTVAEDSRTTDNVTPTTSGKWYSTGTTTSTGLLTSTSCDASALKSVAPSAVGAANGGVLTFGEAVTASGLTLDANATSAGVVSNVAFAATGTIRVANAPSKAFEIPFDFGNATGVENISSYSIIFDDRPKQWTATVGDGVIKFIPPGMMLLFK